MTDFNQMIIPYYSPISAKGGRRVRKFRSRTRNVRTRTRNVRTRKLSSRKLRRTHH